jgi:hypothetical protein
MTKEEISASVLDEYYEELQQSTTTFENLKANGHYNGAYFLIVKLGGRVDVEKGKHIVTFK